MLLNKLLHRSDKSLRMSAPRTYELHGVTIRKLPVGKYLQVLRTLEDAPAIILGEAFPDCSTIPELLTAASNLDREATLQLLSRLLAVVPEQVCLILSGLLDIPKERLLDPDTDDGLSLAELAEVIMAFWKANDVTDFFGTVRRLAQKADTRANIGSSAG